MTITLPNILINTNEFGILIQIGDGAGCVDGKTSYMIICSNNMPIMCAVMYINTVSWMINNIITPSLSFHWMGSST